MDSAEPLRYRNTSNHAELFGLSNLNLQPYESNANAKENMEEMYHTLVLKVNSLNGGPEEKNLNSKLAAACYQLGRIYYDIGENPAMAESMFIKAKNTVEGHESEGDNILSVINSLNMLAYIKEKDDENHEEALKFLLEADNVYQKYNEERSGPATIPSKLLPNCPRKRMITSKNPLISARLFSLFYIIEVYKSLGLITESLISTHFTLKLQLENNLYLQSPLDWALSSALVANLLVEQNAYQQARHHLAAASTFMEKIIPSKFINLFNSETYKQYSADIARCWARYGLRLLKKSKSRLLKQKTHRQPLEIFNNLLFKNFTMWNEERVTRYYVNNYEDAQTLANHTLVNLTATKKYYSFEKTAIYHTDLCMDTCVVYKLLSNFQDNPDKMGKLLQKKESWTWSWWPIDSTRKIANICRRIWYELGTVYSDMMDIKYERQVRNKLVLTDVAIKKINRYATSAIKYYLRFVESFYVQRKLPEYVSDTFVKPVLLAHMHMARCNNKRIVNQKNVKLEILFQCKQYYQTVVDYCQRDPRVEGMMPIEMTTCKGLLQSMPSRVDQLLKTKGPVKYYV
ncbi:LOW QUALITY PROTEIN: protein KBP homolog [Acyrthosiphon pisum]|uniref:KIF-binding protein n=1 Tax=Acyrthosiphon pisum TaxID=7029 RepID=A0A8R2D5I0_ACYPI|nr:LOW QUALITY PROTEIN: protein KBP homolog [Acyrthosiphon pisum]|eukprot:XP_016661625.1 PREDICTED: LOW QUALITY PROTEIN: protein KBP homolog [Acyrthosiphon pisum]